MKNKEGFTFFVDEARKWVYNDLGTAIVERKRRQSRCKSDARAEAIAERKRRQSRAASGRMVLSHEHEPKAKCEWLDKPYAKVHQL